MTIPEVMRFAIEPALSLLPPRMDSPPARAMLIAIGLLESDLRYRKQIRGPAMGLWMFERDGGARGVLTHLMTVQHAQKLCNARFFDAQDVDEVYLGLVGDLVLAAGFARLLLWTEPRPLPAEWQMQEGLRQYLDNWRPGKPHAEKWPDAWIRAWDAVRAAV